MKKVKHICSIGTSLEENTSKHLVSFNGNLIVFNFDRNGIITSVHKDNEYFFTNCKHAKDILNRLISRDNFALGMHDYFIDDKFDGLVYYNFLMLNNMFKDTVDKYSNLIMKLNKIIS